MAKTEILIEDPNLEDEINEADLLVYAKQIGIDVESEKHLMWIAEKGLAASVPEPWLILSDEKGRIFYSNVLTGEKSWVHPSDPKYTALVVKERQKNVNSPLSCSYESKLSSLSDAPPLSSSGKNTPSIRNNTPAPEKKRDLGHFENRRGTKLAPVKLNTLKMPVPSAAQKSPSSMSFMPKGSSLSKNIRRTNDDSDLSRSQFSAKPHIGLPQDDLNESFNSDDGSKYSYEETEDDMERSYDDMNPSDVGSQFSPPHSATGSPEALDINSLVQLGTKLPARFEGSKKTHHLQSLKEEQPPSLSLRKSGQQTFLKPLQQQPKKKAALKSGKPKKTSPLSNKYDDRYGTDDDADSKIAVLNDEQRLRFESIQREWAAMQEELVRDEKTKYDKMVAESSKNLEKEELSLRKENAEKLLKMKSELQKKIEQEESSCQVTLVDIKTTNDQKYAEEEKEIKKKLENLNESMNLEIKRMEKENAEKLSKKKEQLEKESEFEIDKIASNQKTSLSKLEESHAGEIALIKNAHKEKIENLQNSLTKEENEARNKVKMDKSPDADSSRIKMQKIEELLKKEQTKYDELINELKNLQENISAEKENLAKLEEKTIAAQASYEEVQDEVDRTENDLDLLRTEKSALISELNILKENIKNDKSNLLKEKNMDVQSNKKPDTLDKGINTSIPYSVVTQSIQTHIDVRDMSCQMTEIGVSTVEKCTQTFLQTAITADISCQVDLVPISTLNKIHSTTIYNTDLDVQRSGMDSETFNITSNVGNDSSNLDVFVSKVLEKAMMGIGNKMESRFKSIEEKLGSLNKNVDSPKEQFPTLASSNNIPTTDINSHSYPIEQNRQSRTTNCGTDPNDTLPVSTSMSSRARCSCEKGDAGSCDVMQDVKSSIFRLNDILSTSFVPSLGNTVISGFNYPANNYSSPLDSFYTQFRQLQEKHRVTELKNKLQSESWKETGNHLKSNSTNQVRNVIDTEALQFNRALNSRSFQSVLEDPVSRARNLVLREQARSWKQQQQYLSASDQQGFLPLERSNNISISDISPSPTSSGLGAQSPMFPYPFLKFEPDPESEYNEWMSKLKTLQDKIRSHKII